MLFLEIKKYVILEKLKLTLKNVLKYCAVFTKAVLERLTIVIILD